MVRSRDYIRPVPASRSTVVDPVTLFARDGMPALPSQPEHSADGTRKHTKTGEKRRYHACIGEHRNANAVILARTYEGSIILRIRPKMTE